MVPHCIPAAGSKVMVALHLKAEPFLGVVGVGSGWSGVEGQPRAGQQLHGDLAEASSRACSFGHCSPQTQSVRRCL